MWQLQDLYFHKFFQRSGHFFVALERGFFLTLSYLITNTTMNMDRLVIKQILGNEQVTIYYVISLIGKTLVLLIAPINTLVISYLTKRRELLNRSQFGKAVLAGGGVQVSFSLAARWEHRSLSGCFTMTCFRPSKDWSRWSIWHRCWDCFPHFYLYLF